MNRTTTLDPQDTAARVRQCAERVRSEGYGFLICDRREFDAAPIDLRRAAARSVIQSRLGGEWSCVERNGVFYAEHLILGRFAFLPGFETQIGSPDGEAGRYDDEGPMYRIYIEPMLMAAHNVTEWVWERVEKGQGFRYENPSHPKWRLPKTMVSWIDCRDWLKKASAIAGVPLSLPWEEEWEGACRSGSTTPYFWGTDPAQADDYAWHAGNSGGRVHEVGQLRPNAWGLYDMIGNVWEWCRDEWTPDHSAKAATADGVAKTRMAAAAAKFALRSKAIRVEPNAQSASRAALSGKTGERALGRQTELQPLRREDSSTMAESAQQSTSNAQSASRLALSQRAHPSILSHGSEGSAELPEPLSGHRVHRSVTTDSTTADSASPSASNAEAASRFCLPSSAEDAETGLAHRGDCRDTPKDQSSRRTLASESPSTCNSVEARVRSMSKSLACITGTGAYLLQDKSFRRQYSH